MNIRLADAEDIDQIAQLYISNWKAAYKGMLPDTFLNQLDVSYGVQKWSAFLKLPDSRIFIALDPPFFSGFGACSPEHDIENCLYIDSLHVSAGARGKGTGTKLLQTIGKYAADMGYEKMSICIIRGNDLAKNLYCRLGAVHYSFFTDDFGGTRSNSEKLLWNDLTCFHTESGA